MILLPHLTHWLQPLDVGLFGPLAGEYSKEISKLLQNGFRLVGITKRLF
jgi:hypothetical protein